MTTVATAQLKMFAAEWEKLFRSAICSGIVGDARHRLEGGYHISRQDQPKNNYSVTRPDDKKGPANASAAVDMSMNTADMKACTARLRAVYSNKSDPRRKYLNAFNGWDGSGDAARWDIPGQCVTWATPDHKWHVHLEFRRAYTTDPVAMAAVLSILKGESASVYRAAVAPKRPEPKYPGYQLRRDMKKQPDPNVKLVQQRLLARGWSSVGKADGYFGEKTYSAVKRFQEARPGWLTPNGIVGHKTWHAIFMN